MNQHFFWENPSLSQAVEKSTLQCVTPGWEDSLLRIEKAVNDFIWKHSIPKVARATLLMDKAKGGLGVWVLIPKAWAFQSVWIAKHVNRTLNPILTNTIEGFSQKKCWFIPPHKFRVIYNSLSKLPNIIQFGEVIVNK